MRCWASLIFTFTLVSVSLAGSRVTDPDEISKALAAAEENLSQSVEVKSHAAEYRARIWRESMPANQPRRAEESERADTALENAKKSQHDFQERKNEFYPSTSDS
ncbi:hypothetical protein O181_020318 [Austropuccinia psidii MF-1]|uniref:Uncharacterized protein n=1 Tax=Austropuccinia psidii MF-1 TaxID=1389203 RepID=A0A9Q3CB81_9BASI|nr:hypothetical protein [Austropuccinia psidii MF-1]